MKAQSCSQAQPNDLAYTVKTHYAKLLLDHLHGIDTLRADTSVKHNPEQVFITEIYDDGSEDDTHPTYTLRYRGKHGTHLLEIVIFEFAAYAFSDHIKKVMTVNDGEEYYNYIFRICVSRNTDGNPILSPLGKHIEDKNVESSINELDQEILAALDYCMK